MKIVRLFAVAGLLMLLAGAVCAQVYPTVVFDYDPDTFTYTYTVTVTPDDTFAFGYLQVDTKVSNSGTTAWTMRGPYVGSVDQGWTATSVTWDPVNNWDSAIWYTPNHIEPGTLTGNWIGVFELVAPNTFPDPDGAGLTMNGGIMSQNVFVIEVPGPAGIIPEPASMAGLAAGLAGMLGSIIRRRKT